MTEGKEGQRLPIRASAHGDNHTLIRLHEERMGRTEKRLEKMADELAACLDKTDKALNALRREFVERLDQLHNDIERRPRELILYIIVGALLVLGGDTVRAIAERLLP